ncbi:MAG TPA: choice-of-anchor tandem repeat GloVer-containing protein [Methylocella sp.]|nr:choice-of-anchor tandem repeat GloVer-containing protein [Methylocella sp.]
MRNRFFTHVITGSILGAGLFGLATRDIQAAPAEEVIYTFTGGADGASADGVIFGKDGNLYGTTTSGGTGGLGTAFTLSPAASGGWNKKTIYNFCSAPVAGLCPDGGYVRAPNVTFDSTGNLWGGVEALNVANSFADAVFELVPPATDGGTWTESKLIDFPTSALYTSWQGPFAADAQGNVYGATTGEYGFPIVGFVYGPGTVFEVSASGQVSTLANIPGGNIGGVVFGYKGNLYGTTLQGGALVQCPNPLGGQPNPCGSIFQLSPPSTPEGAWTYATIYSFTGVDGYPFATLVADKQGNLYGVTSSGFTSASYYYSSSLGVVFELSPPTTSGGDWTYSQLYSFKGGTDGYYPQASLILDAAGNLYGTTSQGGTPNCGIGAGCGTVFKLTRPATTGGAWAEAILYTFTDSDGPASSTNSNGLGSSGLVADGKGNLYGTTSFGGANNAGEVFEITGAGFVTETPFAAFKGHLKIVFGEKPERDAFELHSEFTLGADSNGINPPKEDVTLAVGPYTATIPAGSFMGEGYGPFHFEGKINGSEVEITLEPNGTKRYEMHAAAEDVDLSGVKSPVPVTLTIGDDSGTIMIRTRLHRDEVSSAE